MSQKEFVATIAPGPNRLLDPKLTSALVEIQTYFKDRPLWLFLDSGGYLGQYYVYLYGEFFNAREQMDSADRALIVIDSGGGDLRTAYKIARLFNRRTGFDALIPRYAKSAATLLALGAQKIYMGRDSELGPLDAQLTDPEREQDISALDEVKSIELLNAAALNVFEEAMRFTLPRTEKKIDFLLPHILTYTGEFISPLMENIDAVHYTQVARKLQVAKEYATRLLGSKVTDSRKLESLMTQLVEGYPEHEFVVDSEEARRIGLSIEDMPPDLDALVEQLIPTLEYGQSILGQFKEREKKDEGDKDSLAGEQGGDGGSSAEK